MLNRRHALTVCLACAGWLPAQASKSVTKQPPQMYGLLAIEGIVDKKKGVISERQLVRYRIKEGHLLPKDVLLRKKQRFFGHFGRHRIVADRFFVSHFGAVIDLRDNSLIHDETMGSLISADERSVLFRINNIYRESGLFVFDMQTHKVARAGDAGVVHLPGAYAPDGERSARANRKGEIWLHRKNGKARRLATGFSASLSMLSSSSPEVPVFWLDNKTVLTQTGNGQLVTVDMQGKIKPLLLVEGLTEPISSPEFHRDLAGRLLYVCEKHYVLDLKKQTAEPTRWKVLGHGFDCEIETTKEYGSIVRHHGKEIGRWFCRPWGAVTAPNLLAIPTARPKRLGYMTGVKIWDAPRRQWLTLKLDVNSLVGWIRL